MTTEQLLASLKRLENRQVYYVNKTDRGIEIKFGVPQQGWTGEIIIPMMAEVVTLTTDTGVKVKKLKSEK